MKNQLLHLVFAAMALTLFPLRSDAATPDAQAALQKTDRLLFIENKGQWHSDVLMLCRMNGLDAWITKQGVNYTFFRIEKATSESRHHHHDTENSLLLGHRVLFELQGNHSNPFFEGIEKQQGYYNYLIGNDPNKHATHVGAYKKAVVKNVYDGIDIRYYFDRGYLRYDFIVHPGADPRQIQFSLRGQYNDVVKDNKIVYTTRFGEAAMAELHTYQGNRTINSRFVKQGNNYTIALGNYDKTQTLIIDPLIYSTYIGGSNWDIGEAIAIDAGGNAYVTGRTESAGYDTTSGAFQTTFGGSSDVFVTKLNASGTDLVYSTFLGGSLIDMGLDIAVDDIGNAYVTGNTQSLNFPTTTGAFQTTTGGSYDVFVTKLNATGTGLIYSTYIGGNNNDYGEGIAIDNNGNAYVTGWTLSTNYDITTGAFQTTNEGNGDVFVTKLSADGSSLIYSTYLGGHAEDKGRAIAVDSNGIAYVTGETASSTFDITAGAFQTAIGTSGNKDAFVTKLTATGTGLIYSTYIGGTNNDYGEAITIDANGNAYVTGWAQSNNFPTTMGAFQTTYAGGASDVFVSKLNASGSNLLYSTYIGGSLADYGYGITIDGSGNAYLTGGTQSSNYKITAGAFQTTNAGLHDVFVSKLNSTGTDLIYSTFIGGGNQDYGHAIVLDNTGNVFLTGRTQSTNYPITSGAFQTTNGGGFDVLVTKMCLAPMAISLSSAANTDNQTLCINTPITNISYATIGATGATITGLPAGVNGNIDNDTITISGTPEETGSFNFIVTLTGGCGTSATATGTLNILPDNSITLTSAAATENQTVCINIAIDEITYITTGATGATVAGLPSGVTANFADDTVKISGTPTVSGTFSYTATLVGGCGNNTASGVILVEVCSNVNDLNINSHFLLYPNPNHGQFTLICPKGGVFELMDITGKRIKTYHMENNRQIINENLTSGLYLLREVSSGKMQKMMIE